MSLFERAFVVVIGEEGGLSTDPADPGNWTGGACGKGQCRGTKYGIAASAHPGLDIRALTVADAQSIYRRAYWDPVGADSLPGPLALLVFDAAVNCGVSRAVTWLQHACGIPADGRLGAQTLAAAQSADATAAAVEFQAQRLAWMSALSTWRTFGAGWGRRLCRLPYLSLTYGAA